MLELCRCGHQADEHAAGRGCNHTNAPSKRFPTGARCACARFNYDPDLADSEVFLAKQLNAAIRNQGLQLEQVDRDELTQVMRISLWRASTKYDSRSHIRFGSFASFEVYNDAIDELRSKRMFGRHGEYRLQPLERVDDDDTAWNVDPVDPLDHHDAAQGRLDRVVAELTVDPADAGSVDLRWVHPARPQPHRGRRFARLVGR
jgi:hypothetical protein